MAKYWWLNLIRGVAALLLGILLLAGLELFVERDALRLALLQFIGIYLLISGIMSLIWGFTVRKRFGLWIFAGIIGVVGGVAYLIRPFVEGGLSYASLAIILGLIILLTGLIHIFGGFKTGSEISRKWGWEHILLGAVEIGIGLLVMLSTIVPVNVLVTALSFWGFIAGIGLISDAFRLRRQATTLGAEEAS
jgi:uncharacterized membrane protein HdeD (DUF308 family)